MTEYKKADFNCLEDIYALELQCFSPPWSEGQLLSEIENEYASVVCAYVEEAFAGFIISYLAGDQAEIYQIATSPRFRRRGIAAKLISLAAKEMMLLGAESLYLEVRASNEAAISLYNKESFTKIGVRKKYYTAPEEDAILMVRNLK